MIRLNKINKYFNRRKANEIHVINNTTLEFPSTGLVCLLGASGSGKTTLLNVIGGLDKAKGEIYYEDLRIKNYKMYKIDKYRRNNMGYIFQNYLLFPEMTVYDNLKFALSLANIYDKDEVEKRINYCLNAVNMINYKRRRASALSGGQQQRVAIARALVKKAKVIIADEPTGNLDSSNTIEVMNIIKKVSKTCLVILVTHDRELANFYADRIIELKDGKVVSDEINTSSSSYHHDDGKVIYLKDLNQKEFEEEAYSLKLYYDEDVKDKPEIKVVYKNGSLIVDVKSNFKVKYLTSNSEVTLKDEHFKKLELTDVDKFDYDNSFFKDIRGRKFDFRKMWDDFKVAFSNFYFVKFRYKLMYLAFMIVGMFIAYTAATISNAYTLDEKAYKRHDSTLVGISSKEEVLDVNFGEILSDESIEYVAYLNNSFSFYVDVSINFQTRNRSVVFNDVKMMPTNIVSEKDLIYGALPSGNKEIALSKWVCDDLTKHAQTTVGGSFSCKDFVGRTLSMLNNLDTFTISGIINRDAYLLFVDYPTYLNSAFKVSSQLPVFRIATDESDSEVVLVKGRLPSESGEIVVHEVFGYEIGQELTSINGVSLGKTFTIVGVCHTKYYAYNLISIEDGEKLLQDYFVGYNLYFISNDKTKSIEHLENLGYTANDPNKEDMSEYSKQRIQYLMAPIISSLVLASALLIFVFFMMRSKVIHRIYDIGVYRALGASRIKVINLFVLEILILTTFTTAIGYGLVVYFIDYVNSLMVSFGSVLLFPWYNVALGLLAIYAFYLFFGLLPVILLLRKTPSQILTKYDI